MKSYILIKESIDLGHAMLASAHAGAAILTTWGDDPVVKDWVANSFRKVVCKVNDEEFEQFAAMAVAGYGRVMTESGLDNQRIAIVFKPREEWPKPFKFLRLYK